MTDSRGSALTVVIPVRDQARELLACITALRAAGVSPASIIVVDDASTDGTAEAAAGAQVAVVRCSSRGGPAVARNIGVRHSDGGIIFFVDADVVVNRSAVERVLTTLRERPDVAAVFGSYDDEPSAPSLVSQYRNLLHHFVHQTGHVEASTFWTGCGAVRRSAFRTVGGFDERQDLNYIEDVELGYRLRRAGYRILLDKRLQGKHLKRWGLVSMVRTDLCNRALPWSRFILAGGGLLGDLNLRWQHRCSVALTGVGCGGLIAGAVQPGALLASAAAFAGVGALNAPFFRFLHRKRGPFFAAACFPLHLLHYACSGLGFGYAWGEVTLRSLAQGRIGGRPSSLNGSTPSDPG